MQINPYILVFKHKVIKELKNKNFTDEKRLLFYQELSKIARKFVYSLKEETDKKDVMNYVKSFIANMSKDNTLTPQQALKLLKNDIDKQPKIQIEKEKPIAKKTYNFYRDNKFFNTTEDGKHSRCYQTHSERS